MSVGFFRLLRTAGNRGVAVYENARSTYRLNKLPKSYTRKEFLSVRQAVLAEYHRCREQSQPEDNLLHPAWTLWRNKFRAALEEGLPENFLSHPVLTQTMVRQGYREWQAHEEQYLTQCSPAAKKVISSVRESYAGHPRIEVPRRGWSVTTLGHAYYLARMSELLGVGQGFEAGTVMEFGGGYGNMCRILRQAARNTTYIIVDLPEFLALQMLFLRLSTPEERVLFITDKNEGVVTGAVNLVPVGLWQRLAVKPDLFLSTFALSESPAAVQATAIERRFFDARAAYITGQRNVSEIVTDDVWKDLGVKEGWVRPETLTEGARGCYEKVEINPFHIGDNYELAASVPRRS